MQKDKWMSPPDTLDLKPHQVDVWRVSLDLQTDPVKLTESTLSVDESERADRFHFAADRHRFIVSHVALRNILSRYLNCGPEDLTFSVNQYGKPSLNDHKLEFNLSNSGDFALIAVTLERKVGVDVERIRSDMEFESIASRYFSQGEVSEFLTLHPEQRVAGFFTCWTRKEAYIKAQGLGLSLPLESFDVSLIPNESAILRATRPDPQEAASWTLLSLDVASGYASVVAVEGAALSLSKGQGLEFRLWDWNSK
jgi:4'-phosphopantetheinyl transferase